MKSPVLEKEITTEQIHEFFDKLMEQIEKDKNSMLIGTASEEKAEMYEKLIKGDMKAANEVFWKVQLRANLQEIFSSYIQFLIQGKVFPKELAFSFGAMSMNVFAITKDDDAAASHQLIMAESEVLRKFYNKGFKVNTMIVEEIEKVNVPTGYEKFTLIPKAK